MTTAPTSTTQTVTGAITSIAAVCAVRSVRSSGPQPRRRGLDRQRARGERALGIGEGVFASAVNLALQPTVAGLETFVVRRLARTLGLYIGGADIGAVDLECGGVGLVG